MGRTQRRLAIRLREAGLSPGDRVLLFMRNHPRYLELLWAAWWAGLAVVPLNAKLHAKEAEWIIDNAQARWGFVTRDVAPEAPTLPARPFPSTVVGRRNSGSAVTPPAVRWPWLVTAARPA